MVEVTNDEIRMSNQIQMKNDENSFRHSSLVGISH